LGQILFIADYIEPGRKHVTRFLRASLMQMDLNEMTLKVLNEQTAYLRDRGYIISESSILLFDKLSNFGRIKSI
ncbi:MAG: hypothetical protein KAQ93_06710, partial [Spirochaetales bacterium]|nr:hypothetical protein [Spirochaetales bacterium]